TFEVSARSPALPGLSTAFDTRAGLAPKMPGEENLKRSMRRLTLVSSASTRHWRRTPSPPRKVPGPPESRASSERSTRTGNSVSIASTGVFITLTTSSSIALTPSASGRAPVPPLRISYCEYQRPDLGSRPALDSDPPAALPGAGTRPGSACASTRMITEVVTWLGRTYMLTGPGKRGLSSVPSGGQVTRPGRDTPAFPG